MNAGMNKRTSQTDHWATPAWLYDALDAEFGFNYDPCPLNCEGDALLEDWSGKRCFINPPYSNIEPWVRKARQAEIAVLLLPVRTDSNWHRLLIEKDIETRYFRKRIAFLQNGLPMDSPRFASLVAVVRGRQR